jgi:hypothetical protein
MKENLDQQTKSILMDLKSNLHDNYISILPSFFKCLIFIHDQDIDFSIVFSTFGDDFPLIKKELNYFMQGKHPVYNKKEGKWYFQFNVGKNMDVNYLMEDCHIGRYFRKSKEIDDTIF